MGIQISPESELGKEMAKWEKPYRFEPFPKMLYRANRRPDGKPSCSEADDRLFGGQPGSAELFSATCQMVVQSETELTKYLEMGWREGPTEAMEYFEQKEQGLGNAAAHRAHDDRNMGEKAQAEVKAAEDATSEHVPEIPRTPVRKTTKVAPAKKGRVRRGA